MSKFRMQIWRDWASNFGWHIMPFYIKRGHLTDRNWFRQAHHYRKNLLFPAKHWRVIRQSDGIILAQSKDAPE